MDALAGVDFIEGDFTEQSVFDQIQQVIGESVPSAVLSDMATKMSGIVSVDQPKAMYLARTVGRKSCSVKDCGPSVIITLST